MLLDLFVSNQLLLPEHRVWVKLRTCRIILLKIDSKSEPVLNILRHLFLLLDMQLIEFNLQRFDTVLHILEQLRMLSLFSLQRLSHVAKLALICLCCLLLQTLCSSHFRVQLICSLVCLLVLLQQANV
jgi:hypothetical protein